MTQNHHRGGLPASILSPRRFEDLGKPLPKTEIVRHVAVSPLSEKKVLLSVYLPRFSAGFTKIPLEKPES